MHYDGMIIGTGQAGPSPTVRLAARGCKIAIVERNRFGGTCVNTGCILTKTLIASARAAWMARHAEKYGVVIEGSVSVDMAKVKARMDKIAGASTAGLENWRRSTTNCTVYEGHARFVSNHEIAVGDKVLSRRAALYQRWRTRRRTRAPRVGGSPISDKTRRCSRFIRFRHTC
jgi:pyruvate/2-oxoglutarate dehydrogenase complex dihydrolipoamide dehydrogenase (E3) component